MTSTTRTLISVSVLVFILSLVGFALALSQQWPSQFILGSTPDSAVTTGDLLTGTATSAPLVPLMLLVVATLLASGASRWSTAAVVVLCLLGLVFIAGGIGEAVAPPTPYVSRAVLVVAGAAAGTMGLALLVSGVVDLADRVRRAHVDRHGRRLVAAVEEGPVSSDDFTDTRGGLRSNARAHPIAAFLMLAYASALLVFALPVLSNDGIGIVAVDVPGVLPFVLVATVALLGAAVVVSRALGPAAVADLWRRTLRMRVDVRWYLLAFGAPPASAFLVAMLARGADPVRALAGQPVRVLAPMTLFTFAAFVLINWWEEAAWTGFVLDRLQPRIGPLGASVATTWMQAVIHLPLVFVVDGITDGRVSAARAPLYVAALFVLPVPVRVVTTWLYNVTGSIPVAGLLHASMGTVTGSALLPIVAPGVDAAWVYAAVAALALAVLTATRGDLRFAPRAAIVAVPGGRRRGTVDAVRTHQV